MLPDDMKIPPGADCPDGIHVSCPPRAFARGGCDLFSGHGADHELVVHLLRQIALVEQAVVLRDHLLQVVLAVVGVEQGAEPEHAQVALHARGAGEPAVGAVGRLVVAAGAYGLQLLPGGVVRDGFIDAVGGEDYDLGVPRPGAAPCQPRCRCRWRRLRANRPGCRSSC